MPSVTEPPKGPAVVPEKQAAPVAPVVPQVPLKKPITTEWVKLNWAGQCFSDYSVTLPPLWTLADLGSTKIWSTIQGGPTAFRVLDKLTITDFEQNFFAEARVVAATEAGASIQIFAQKSMPPRDQNLPETEDWRLAYHGGGFALANKRTGATTGMIYNSRMEATRALFSMVPRVPQ